MIFLTLAFCSSGLAQQFNLGFPSINNFTPSAYNGGTQNWRLDISPNGIIYAANNDGLLKFDGNEWKIYPLPNRTIARSIDYHNDTIYIGGQDELGYFAKNNNGDLIYHSLWEMIPKENQDIADIWDLAYYDRKIYFRNFKNVYSLQSNIFRTEKENVFADFMAKDNSKLFFNQRGTGIFKIRLKSNIEADSIFNDLAEKEVIAFLENENNALVFTAEEGIFFKDRNSKISLWSSNAQAYLIKNKITSAIKLKNKNIAVGTRLGGLVVLDSLGKALYVLNKSKGLQSNSITSIVEDNWSNLWLGTYFGIDRINFGSGFNSFYPDKEFEGAVFDIELWDDKWWFATGNGLYFMPYESYNSPFDPLNFQLVSGSEGQVWGLDILDNQLLVAHHTGAFTIENGKEINNMGISDGVWKFVKLNKDILAIGCYNGLYIYKRNGTNWSLFYKIDSFSESSRILIVDDLGNLWISHPYRGLFKIEFDSNFENYTIKKYDEKDGYKCNQRNYIFNISGNPVVANDCGLYKYHQEADRFYLDSLLESYIGKNKKVTRLFDHKEGIWYIGEHETGLIAKDPHTKELIRSKKLFPHIGKAFVAGFENLYPVDTNNLLLCTDKGIKFYQDISSKIKKPFLAIIETLTVIPTNRFLKVNNQISHNLSPRERGIHLYFRSNGLINIDLLGYEYKLEGLDENWIFSNLPYKEYNNLEPGSYTFQLRVIDNLGYKSQITKFQFEIAEFWYKTNLAKLIYLLFISSAIALMLIVPNKKYKKDTANLVIKQQETEKELEIVRQEKLEDEIKFKNNELANVTLHLVQKKQTINSLREELKKLQRNTSDTKVSKSLKHLNSLLQSDDRLEDDWEKFTLLFDQVHLDFIQRLKSKYPQLTPKDQKLCAFLRMNLSTKEIAPLMNISIRGVEISRYRLRKKMNLESSKNLTEAMLDL